ncbi:uncharacterized protein LOC113205063 isoform X2 [Frankliniella occidentalis]|nr:uncharacterized protein LOC113205063 isoform X2 [Frankliniella occidentalis]
MTRSEERRPLAPIQIRETRFRVPAVSSEGVLPSPQDPNFVFALNTESRVNRLMADAVSTMKYKYDVKSILQRAIGGSKALESLNNSQFIYGAQRNVIVQALVDYLFQSVSHKAQVSTIMRECMAIQLVATWPALKMHLYSKEDRPWHYWYNADQNTGYLENATQVKQRTSKRSGASGIRKSRNTTGAKKPRKLTLAAVQDNHDDSDPEEYIRDVTEARELVGHPHQRSVVLQLMIQTHERRRTKIVLKQVDTFKILNEFPQFMHFHGDVIEQEFNLIYEQKQSCFVREFVYDMVPKLLKIAESDPKTFENCTPSQYDVINAIVVLAKMLPTPVRSFEHERTMPLQASLSDFFNVIPVSSDPNQYVTQRQAESEYKVQPHILATGNQQGVRKMWLVVDSKLMELHRNATPVTAIDLLIKSFFVFHLHFPLAWKNVLRFLQVHIFQIPLENERWSKFSEVHLRLKHFRV